MRTRLQCRRRNKEGGFLRRESAAVAAYAKNSTCSGSPADRFRREGGPNKGCPAQVAASGWAESSAGGSRIALEQAPIRPAGRSFDGIMLVLLHFLENFHKFLCTDGAGNGKRTIDDKIGHTAHAVR